MKNFPSILSLCLLMAAFAFQSYDSISEQTNGENREETIVNEEEQPTAEPVSDIPTVLDTTAKQVTEPAADIPAETAVNEK